MISNKNFRELIGQRGKDNVAEVCKEIAGLDPGNEQFWTAGRRQFGKERYISVALNLDPRRIAYAPRKKPVFENESLLIASVLEEILGASLYCMTIKQRVEH